MTDRSIGIFTTADKEHSDGSPISFFGCDDTTLLAALYQHASKIAGPGMTQFDPEDGIAAKRVGEVVVQPVKDEAVYKVQVQPVGKPDTGRKPSGEPGTWAIQSVILSKDNFDEDSAKKWIEDHDEFGNYGVDETETSYRFRQYDPEYFSEFRTVPLAEGIAAVYGKIAEEKEEEEKTRDRLEAALSKYQAIRDVNKGIMARGLQVLSCTTHITKDEAGEDVEERFVLSMVLEPNDGENGAPFNPDTQKDVYSTHDIRKTAHGWMENGGMIDLMHSWRALGRDTICPVETYIAPVEFTIGKEEETVLAGTWMMGARIYNDDLWEKAKNNELGAWSIGGEAVRTPLEGGVQ